MSDPNLAQERWRTAAKMAHDPNLLDDPGIGWICMDLFRDLLGYARCQTKRLVMGLTVNLYMIYKDMVDLTEYMLVCPSKKVAAFGDH